MKHKKILGILLCVIIVTTALTVAVTAKKNNGSTNGSTGVPFTIDLTGNVNGVIFTVEVIGMVDPIGTYTATLTFSEIPPNFHPVVMTAYVCSICCYLYAAEANGGINLHSLGVTSYHSIREVTFPNDETLTIDVTVEEESIVSCTGTIYGTVSVPTDLTGMAFYRELVEPTGPGEAKTEGEGSIFRHGGEDIQVNIETSYSFDRNVLVPFPQLRTVTDTGYLDGLIYNVQIHSIIEKAE